MSAPTKKAETFSHSGQVVDVQRVDPGAMFLRQQVGTGDIGGRDFTVTLTSGGALLVEFDNPRAVYAVTTQSLIEAAIRAEGIKS